MKLAFVADENLPVSCRLSLQEPSIKIFVVMVNDLLHKNIQMEASEAIRLL